MKPTKHLELNIPVQKFPPLMRQDKTQYKISSAFADGIVRVYCDEATARVLLPLWSKEDPNATVCTDTHTGECIVSFGPLADIVS